jgi:hypothetical protein
LNEFCNQLGTGNLKGRKELPMQTTDRPIDQTTPSSDELSRYRETLMNLDTVILDTSLLISEKAPTDRTAHHHVLMAKELQRHFIYAPAPSDVSSALNALNSVLGVLNLARELAGTDHLSVLTGLSGT